MSESVYSKCIERVKSAVAAYNQQDPEWRDMNWYNPFSALNQSLKALKAAEVPHFAKIHEERNLRRQAFAEVAHGDKSILWREGCTPAEPGQRLMMTTDGMVVTPTQEKAVKQLDTQLRVDLTGNCSTAFSTACDKLKESLKFSDGLFAATVSDFLATAVKTPEDSLPYFDAQALGPEQFKPLKALEKRSIFTEGLMHRSRKKLAQAVCYRLLKARAEARPAEATRWTLSDQELGTIAGRLGVEKADIAPVVQCGNAMVSRIELLQTRAGKQLQDMGALFNFVAEGKNEKPRLLKVYHAQLKKRLDEIELDIREAGNRRNETRRDPFRGDVLVHEGPALEHYDGMLSQLYAERERLQTTYAKLGGGNAGETGLKARWDALAKAVNTQLSNSDTDNFKQSAINYLRLRQLQQLVFTKKESQPVANFIVKNKAELERLVDKEVEGGTSLADLQDLLRSAQQKIEVTLNVRQINNLYEAITAFNTDTAVLLSCGRAHVLQQQDTLSERLGQLLDGTRLLVSHSSAQAITQFFPHAGLGSQVGNIHPLQFALDPSSHARPQRIQSLIGRINMLLTHLHNLRERLGRSPDAVTEQQMRDDVVQQLDGLNYCLSEAEQVLLEMKANNEPLSNLGLPEEVRKTFDGLNVLNKALHAFRGEQLPEPPCFEVKGGELNAEARAQVIARQNASKEAGSARVVFKVPNSYYSAMGRNQKEFHMIRPNPMSNFAKLSDMAIYAAMQQTRLPEGMLKKNGADWEISISASQLQGGKRSGGSWYRFLKKAGQYQRDIDAGRPIVSEVHSFVNIHDSAQSSRTEQQDRVEDATGQEQAPSAGPGAPSA